jgi:hypothetical protein
MDISITSSTLSKLPCCGCSNTRGNTSNSYQLLSRGSKGLLLRAVNERRACGRSNNSALVGQEAIVLVHLYIIAGRWGARLATL